MTTPSSVEQEAVAKINARFVSGNSVPVERVHVTADEWGAVKAEIDYLKRQLNPEPLPEGLFVPWADSLQKTALSAGYWLEHAQKENSVRLAIEAINHWKNAAYYFAEQTYKLTASNATQPEGFVLVPIEPTEAMCDEAYEIINAELHGFDCPSITYGDISRAYRAMIITGAYLPAPQDGEQRNG
jgi:hypothetical protein